MHLYRYLFFINIIATRLDKLNTIGTVVILERSLKNSEYLKIYSLNKTNAPVRNEKGIKKMNLLHPFCSISLVNTYEKPYKILKLFRNKSKKKKKPNAIS